MSYKKNSAWNDKNEVECLLIFKVLQQEGFPRGKLSRLCQELSKITNLSAGSISAKVCNYKSIAGVNAPSNASKNTMEIFEKYGSLSIQEIEKLIDRMS
ncbi:hypothetical protein NBRC116494_07330 [Aurantivibrio plasticivorans]